MNNQNNQSIKNKKDSSAFSKNNDIEPIMTARRSEMSASSGTARSANEISRNGTSVRASSGSSRSTAQTASGKKLTASGGASGSAASRAVSSVPARKITGSTASDKTAKGSGASENDHTVVFSKTTGPNRVADKKGSSGSAVRPYRKAVSSVSSSRKTVDDEYYFTIDSGDDRKQSKRTKRNKAANSVLSSLMKAAIYIVFVLVLSGFISYFGISIGNDVFALVKDDSVVNLTIGENATFDDIAKVLSDNDVIQYPEIFKIYAELRKDSGEFVAGTYEVGHNMNYDTLLDVFKGPKVERKEVRITIPEGYTVDNIIDLFVNGYGMGTKEGFIDAIQNYDFDYWFVDELVDLPSDRKYRLEGYLYPDTYDFYSDWSEVSIITKFLDNFEKKFDDRYRDKCAQMGMSVDEVVTLASIIQMEAKYDIEYELISSVFHNRMNNPHKTGGKLESDATIQYILDERNEDLTQNDLNIDSRYNSYLYAGLPPGPISNPTTIAINYALFPAKTNYYFFVAQKNGYSLFAATNVEHEQNKLIAAGK